MGGGFGQASQGFGGISAGFNTSGTTNMSAGFGQNNLSGGGGMYG